MMQVSSDRNTGEINHNSSHLDNLISFYKFVQVHLGRNNVYHENVVINKPISFICADSEDNNYPIICGYNEELPSVSSFAETYFYNIYFANNKNSNGILISNSNCTLENCAFVNNGKSSLYAKDKADVTIANCFFDTN